MWRVASGLVIFAIGCGAPARSSPVIASSDTHLDSTTPMPCSRWENRDDPTRAPADVAAPPERAFRSATGLRWCVLRAGQDNQHPSLHDRVTVHYTGWTTDGQMFDSSRTGGAPTFPVDALIAGWTEGLQTMSVGEVARFWIPPMLAYGASTAGPRGMLVFDIELIAISPNH